MKKIIILSLILSVLFLSSCDKKEVEIKKYYNTTTVSSGSLDTTESYVGYVSGENQVEQGAKVGGKVIKTLKKVGDKVKAGELIAQLDGAEASSAYSSSNEIITSLENLKTSTSNTFDKQIESNNQKIDQLNKSIEMAEINIETASSGVDDTKSITDSQIQTVKNQISQAEIGLQTSQINLQNTTNTFEQKQKDIYTNANSAINQAIILGNNLIDYFDNIYGVTQKNKSNNDSFEDYLSKKDTKYLDNAEDELKNIIKKFDELKEYSQTDDKEIVLEYLNGFYELFNTDVTNFLNISYKVMENTIASSNLDSTSINTIKANITTYQTNNQDLILSVSGNYMVGLKGSIDNINDFENQKTSALDLLQKQVEASENQISILEESLKTYEAQKKSSETQVSSGLEQAKKQKEVLESQLSEAKLGIEALKEQKKASLDEIEAQIAQVKSGKSTSAVMIENAKIYAPFDGVITKKYVDVGQVVGAGTPIYQINSTNNLEINVLVGEDIVNNLKVGDSVGVEIDGIDYLVNGNIKNIYPSKDLTTKKTTVEINLEKDENLKIGSYSKVNFKNNTDETGIIIPNNAIISKYLIPGVYVLEDKKAIFKKIEIINQTNNFSQIKGLNIGDEIITDGKENIYDGEILN